MSVLPLRLLPEHVDYVSIVDPASGQFADRVDEAKLPPVAFGDDAKQGAQGAALLADGLAGGRHAPLVERLRIREASGSVLDLTAVNLTPTGTFGLPANLTKGTAAAVSPSWQPLVASAPVVSPIDGFEPVMVEPVVLFV